MSFEEELNEIIEKANKAQEAQRIGDWKKVIDQLKNLKEKTSKKKEKNQQVKYFLARAYKNLGNIYSNKFYLGKKKNKKAVKVKKATNNYKLAIENYNSAIKENPSDAENHLLCGNVYLNKSTYPSAITKFKKAVELAKKHIDEKTVQECKCKAKEFILTRKALYLTAHHREFKKNSDLLFTGKLDDKTLILLLRLWQAAKDIKKEHEIEDKKETLKLAHYTSLETVHALLPGKKSDESHFRLKNVRGMNDPQEGNKLIKEVKHLNKFYGKKNKKKFSYFHC